MTLHHIACDENIHANKNLARSVGASESDIVGGAKLPVTEFADIQTQQTPDLHNNNYDNNIERTPPDLQFR